MESIWKKDIEMPKFPSAENSEKVDVLVIGGGLCGLLCGYFLKEQGAKYAIVEKNTVASGVTANTTAKITVHHGLIYKRLLKESGPETAELYLKANTAALEMYRDMAKFIPCDFQEKDNYIYTMSDKKAILEEIDTLSRLGAKPAYAEPAEIPLKAQGAVRMPGQGQFHPLKFASAIAEGQSVYEHSFADEIRKERYGYRVTVQNRLGKDVKINAEKVIVATHFPYIDRWGLYFMKMYQQRSYVLALEKSDGKTFELDGMYIGLGAEEENPLNLSFRSCGKYLLLGGGGGRTGTAYPAYSRLSEAAEKLYPGSKAAAFWAAQDCMSLDGIPYIGPYAGGKDGLLVACGFNKWGMTGAMTAAMALTGKLEKELCAVFSPQRSMMKPQLFANIFETAKNFLRPTAPRCTHLGCSLHWNKSEKTWDCACHGSRYTETGKVIDNPAQVDLKSRGKVRER